jgi:hypothetical protein
MTQVIDAIDDRNRDMDGINRCFRRDDACSQQSVRELVDLCSELQHRNLAQQCRASGGGSYIATRRLLDDGLRHEQLKPVVAFPPFSGDLLMRSDHEIAAR